MALHRGSTSGKGPKSSPIVSRAGPAWHHFPHIMDFLTQDRWSENVRRELGTLLIVFEDGRFRVWVNDKDGRRTAWCSCESVEGLLDALEANLATDGLEWRAARPGGRGRSDRS